MVQLAPSPFETFTPRSRIALEFRIRRLGDRVNRYNGELGLCDVMKGNEEEEEGGGGEWQCPVAFRGQAQSGLRSSRAKFDPFRMH